MAALISFTMQLHQLWYQHQREEHGIKRAKRGLKLALLLRKICTYLSFADAFLLKGTASELTSSVGPQVPTLFCYEGC